MPTGYTYDVQQGKLNFNQFVWRCARAFGALVLMREEPMDAPIPAELKPDTDFYEKSIQRDKEELQRLEAMNPAELDAHVLSLRAEARAGNERRQQERDEHRRNYEAMQRQIINWRPPSSDHDGIKRFMLEQIQSSIEGDCNSLYREPEPVNPDNWRRERIVSLKSSIERSERHIREEIARTEERNTWLQKLRESVPYEEPPK